MPVLRIGAIEFEADIEAAGGDLAPRLDVVAGEEVNSRGRGCDYLTDAELAIGIVGGGATLLDVRASDPGAARDVVPENIGHAAHEVRQERLAPLFRWLTTLLPPARGR